MSARIDVVDRSLSNGAIFDGPMRRGTLISFWQLTSAGCYSLSRRPSEPKQLYITGCRLGPLGDVVEGRGASTGGVPQSPNPER
eukprot:scaffold1561_cov404-Prasinococcus_capsulatus_cf.AAC.1